MCMTSKLHGIARLVRGYCPAERTLRPVYGVLGQLDFMLLPLQWGFEHLTDGHQERCRQASSMKVDTPT